LLVEAAEDLFIPVAIYNNTEGDADAEVRMRYQEPAWNFQVVRIVDGDGADLVPRLSQDWTVAGVTEAMAAGLKSAKQEVPTWLQLLAMESRAEQRGVESAIFGMA
jgi:hypothetical protein